MFHYEKRLLSRKGIRRRIFLHLYAIMTAEILKIDLRAYIIIFGSRCWERGLSDGMKRGNVETWIQGGFGCRRGKMIKVSMIRLLQLTFINISLS